MISNDIFIENYLIELFFEPKGLHIPRDFKKEKVIMAANMAEIQLANDLLTFQKYLPKEGVINGEMKYKISLRNNHFPWRIQYTPVDNKKTEQECRQIFINKLAIFWGKDFSVDAKGHKNVNDLSLLTIYCSVLNEKIPSVIEKLSDSNSETLFTADWPISNNYIFFIDNDVRLGTMAYLYAESQKLLLPCFISKKDHHVYNFISRAMSTSLLYSSKISTDSFVIMTDSPELASINQKLVNRYFKDIVWVSWYGDREAVDGLKLEMLHKAKCVYYLVAMHSGFSWKSVLETMEAVRGKLTELNIEPRFITYASNFEEDSPVPQTCFFPKIYSYESFKKMFFPGAQISISDVLIQGASNEGELCEPALLFYPFIYEQSISLIQGDEDSSARYFATCLAWSLTAQLPLIKPWHCVQPAYVHYLCLKTPKSRHSYSLKRVSEFVKYNHFVANRLNFQIISPIEEKNSLNRLLSDLKSVDDAYKTIFLDGLSYETPEEATALKALIKELRSQSWAVVVITEGKSMHRLINPETTIKLRKEKEIDGKIRMRVCFNSCFDKGKNFYVEGNLNKVPPSLKKSNKFSKRKRYSEDAKHKLKKQMYEYFRKEIKPTEIMNKLKLSQSMYKKLKSQLQDNKLIARRLYRKKSSSL